ncbi:rhodanese-like domain-containing protein [Haloprofundus salinisoli]|uniref:rhodanese-like domain-containing protein n=1 Tax=Haloprofundus salinisoli TaxID=2876193 RepID=UPI001CCA5355|nr:rhodanese-like domain-containing protein [Haloprofundus salinisoli]
MDGEITPQEVEALLDGDAPPRVVDIRSPAAFDREHIPGSENIPFAELPNRVESLSDAERIVTVCPHGQASRQAARLIKSYEGTRDAHVESMEGGLTEWTGDVDSARPTDDEGPQSPF